MNVKGSDPAGMGSGMLGVFPLFSLNTSPYTKSRVLHASLYSVCDAFYPDLTCIQANLGNGAVNLCRLREMMLLRPVAHG